MSDVKDTLSDAMKGIISEAYDAGYKAGVQETVRQVTKTLDAAEIMLSAFLKKQAE